MAKVYHVQPSLFPPYAIYALVDPRDNAIRYIGMSKQPEFRLAQHTQRRYGSAYDWIQELLQQNLRPILRIIEKIENEHAAEVREMYWIRFYAEQKSPLLNKQPNQRRTQWPSKFSQSP